MLDREGGEHVITAVEARKNRRADEKYLKDVQDVIEKEIIAASYSKGDVLVKVKGVLWEEHQDIVLEWLKGLGYKAELFGAGVYISWGCEYRSNY